VKFADFISQLTRNGFVGSWNSAPKMVNAQEGDRFRVLNRGGEAHTFTEVEEFGGGIVPSLNELAHVPSMAPECQSLAPGDFIAPGQSVEEEGEGPPALKGPRRGRLRGVRGAGAGKQLRLSELIGNAVDVRGTLQEWPRPQIRRSWSRGCSSSSGSFVPRQTLPSRNAASPARRLCGRCRSAATIQPGLKTSLNQSDPSNNCKVQS